jgi:hypothetical protein
MTDHDDNRTIEACEPFTTVTLSAASFARMVERGLACEAHRTELQDAMTTMVRERQNAHALLLAWLLSLRTQEALTVAKLVREGAFDRWLVLTREQQRLDEAMRERERLERHSEPKR